MDINQDPLLIKFFQKRHPSKSTRKLYTYYFNKFYFVTGLTPTSAITLADEEEEQGIRLKRRTLNDYLDQFETYLEAHHDETTLRNAMTFIRSFYRFNMIELPVSTRRSPNPTPADSLLSLPDADDIRKAISHSNVKYQAFIVLLASSGMRQGDARNLTLKHLINSLEKYAKLTVNDLTDIGVTGDLLPKNIGPLQWDLWMQKTSRYYTTFSTPESLSFILNYLNSQPPQIVNSDSFIFRGRNDNQLSPQAVGKYFRVINNRCNFPERRGQIFFRPHNLRKWFGNQLKKTMGYLEPRVLMGHQVLDDTGSRYLKPDYNDLYNKYYDSMDAVTLYGKVEVHDRTDDRLIELEKKVAEQQAWIEILQRKDKLRKPD